MNGRLEGLSVPDLLWNLCRRRSTGVLHVTARGITKRVYIDSGRIVFALSSDPNDRLGELLLRDGLITLDQLEGAIVLLTSGKRLGTILVGAGHLTPENLVRGVLNQVRGIVLSLFPLEEGEYAFVEGPLPTEEVVTLGMRTAEILLQGIRQVRSFTRIRKSVGPPATRFRLDTEWRTVLDGLEIRDGERMLLQRLDEAGTRGASIDAMCREVFLSNFEIYQALWAFLVLGVIEEVDRASEVLPGRGAAGRVERTTLPEILVRLSKDEVTGVLHMARGATERTLHIKSGQCIFATSNSVDDGLIAHLLRRGVISLTDREETARRLLSNKRVGTILTEMGVIDENDLRATVREQLSEIVFDTFRWDQGDFQFLEGELPTIEEITLTRTVEDLVFAGVRRISSWSRVKDGCGGLGARLVLLPEYLSVLDKMTVGPEEWELISVLKTPKTVLEICRESVLGDFRSCQIIWALRLLGGVGEAAIEVSVDSALGLLETQPAEAPALPAAREPEPDRAPLPISEADDSAEVISEPWRLAAERPPAAASAPPEAAEPVESLAPSMEIMSPMEIVSAMEIARPVELAPEPAAPVAPPAPAMFELDSTAGATVSISRVDVDAALRAPDDGLPKFELGLPGTSLEDMKVDMRPAAAPVFELGDEESAAAEAEAVDFNRTARLSREEVESALAAPAPPEASAQPDEAVEPVRAAEPPTMPAAEAPRPAEIEMPAPPAPSPREDGPAWEPPAELDGAIASFNARHVVVFRAMRAEIGAGAANFVRSCRSGLGERFTELFTTAELRADGSWDPDGLKRSVVQHRIEAASEGFIALLEGELERLRVHMGDKRAAALADQLTTIP